MARQEHLDGIVVARLQGIAKRHAGWTDPQGDRRADALSELRQVGGDRGDLMAQAAGLLLGFYPSDHIAYEHHRIAAQLVIEAGADVSRLEHWIQIGAERGERARSSRGYFSPRKDEGT